MQLVVSLAHLPLLGLSCLTNLLAIQTLALRAALLSLEAGLSPLRWMLKILPNDGPKSDAFGQLLHFYLGEYTLYKCVFFQAVSETPNTVRNQRNLNSLGCILISFVAFQADNFSVGCVSSWVCDIQG